MNRWFLISCLAIGSALIFGCGQEADQAPIELVDDSPVLGVWFLQAAGQDQPVAIDSTIRFEFKAHGSATYERETVDPQDAERYELTYNLVGNIISIDGDRDSPDIPRITGKIDLDQDGQTLRITTHNDENWLLIRAQLTGGGLEIDRRTEPSSDQAEPLLARVQHFIDACSTFISRKGRAPERVMQLIDAGLITPEALTLSGKRSDLPRRFDRMTPQEQGDWLAKHSAFVFFFEYAGTDQASSLVVSTLPENGKSVVCVGMADGAVYHKPAKEAAQLIEFQIGSLPDRWPDSAWSRQATVGLEPLSD